MRRAKVDDQLELVGLSDWADRKVGELSQKLDALSQMLEVEKIGVEEAVYHVVPHEDGWAVKREGAEPAVSVHDTKKEALSAGRDEAKKNLPSQLVVHKQDRSVQDSYTYDEDEE